MCISRRRGASSWFATGTLASLSSHQHRVFILCAQLKAAEEHGDRGSETGSPLPADPDTLTAPVRAMLLAIVVS